MIWVRREAEYFCKQHWTGQITGVSRLKRSNMNTHPIADRRAHIAAHFSNAREHPPSPRRKFTAPKSLFRPAQVLTCTSEYSSRVMGGARGIVPIRGNAMDAKAKNIRNTTHSLGAIKPENEDH